MKKYISVLYIILCIILSGCGNIDTSPDSTPIASNIKSNTIEKVPLDNNDKNDDSQDNKKNEISLNTPNPDKDSQKPSLNKTKNEEIEIFNLSEDTPYKTSEHSVKILGLKEYKSLKSKLYVDKPGKGNKFLVLFLAVANNTKKDEYINVNSLSAKVDSKKIENTFLVNEPKNYSTIFTNIAAGERKAGFIVWEVPSGWKKFEMKYDGWTYTNNLSVKCEFTPDDLSDPPIYSEEVLY